MAETTDTNWAVWSREAVHLMQERNEAWITRYGLANMPYHWDLATAQCVFYGANDHVVAHLCVVGSVSTQAGTFLWSWDNEGIPANAKVNIDSVRQFGEEHGLTLLIDAEWPADKAEGLEMLAVASRILEAEGAWVEQCDGVTLFFALDNIHAST